MKRIAALVLLISAVPVLAPSQPAAATVTATVPARTPLPPTLVRTGITPGDCGAPARGTVRCFAVHGPAPSSAQVAHIGRRAGAAQPATSSVGPYLPSQVQSMYGVPASARSTKTVAIVEAGAGRNTAAVMNFYRSYFGLPSCWAGCFTELNQSGGTTLPYFTTSDPTGGGWLTEIDLDVEAVAATCPTCHILLVDARSSSSLDMDAAVRTAVARGADVVSMSWGSAKIDDPTSADDAAVFAAGGGTPVYVAATGDNGYYGTSPDGGQTLGTSCLSSTSDRCANYPAAFPGVVAVGGTSVTPNGSGGWTSQGWVDAGSGCTSDPKPSWQVGVTTCNGRAVADVSALADPGYIDAGGHQVGLGLFVWLDDGSGSVGAADVGGTSLATPIVAAMYALQGNSTVGPAAPYADRSATNLTDVTGGPATGSCSVASWCTPGTGWDGPTGIGTPRGLSLFSSVAPGPSTAVLSPQQGVDLVAHTGQPVDQAPLSVTGGGTPAWTATGLPPGLGINGATGAITGTPTTAGHSSVTVSAGGASEVISIDVYDALSLTDGAIAATAGSPVSVTPVGVHGGSGTLDWALAGPPPAWLHLDPRTGTFSGTPSASDVGTSSVTVDALDHADPAQSGSATVTITVAAAPPPTPTPTPTPTPVSPAPTGPVGPVATSVHARLGKIGHTKRARITVSVLGGTPAGTLTVYDGTRPIAVATVTPANHASFGVLLKRLAAGRHRLRLVFTPTVATVLGSSTAVTARVR